MTMTSEENKTEYKIKVMQAYLDGRSIQLRMIGTKEWTRNLDATPDPCWDWFENEYRIKPTQLELWVNVYPNTLVQLYQTKEEAIAAKSRANNGGRTILMREVIEETE